MVALGGWGMPGKAEVTPSSVPKDQRKQNPTREAFHQHYSRSNLGQAMFWVLRAKVPVFTKTPLISLISPHLWIHVWRFSPFHLVFPVLGDHSTSKLHCQTPRSDFNFGKLFNCQRLRLTHETNNTRTPSPQHFLGVLVLPWVMMKPEGNAFSFQLFPLPYRVSLVAPECWD